MTDVVTDVMLRFAGFLTASWEAARRTAETHQQAARDDFMSDWAQANWELLVETPLREMTGFESAFLEPYGDGADCNGASPRVWMPGALPTHRILCHPRSNELARDLLTGNTIESSQGAMVFDRFAVKSDRG